jgi:phage tail-like protein
MSGFIARGGIALGLGLVGGGLGGGTLPFGMDTKVLRCRVRIRPPSAIPVGCAWTFQMLVDGYAHATVPIPVGPVRVLADVAANVGVLGGGTHTISFKLGFSGGSATYSAELPGVVVDALVEDPTVASPGVFNRSPEPGESFVALADPIAFDVYDTESAAVDISRTTVTVNGVVVFTGGAFTSGWTGSSTTTLSTMNAVRWSLVPSAALSPITVYTIRVQSAVVGGPANALDTSWSFTTVDTTAPLVLSATALDPSTVLVLFSKAMLEASDMGSADALNPDNYTIALVSGAPAVTPQVASVAPGATGSSALLTTADPLTANAVYQVTVGPAVTDSLGNLLADAPSNAANCAWMGCPVPAGRDPMSIWNLLPQGARTADAQGTGDLLKFILCLQSIYNERVCDVDAWSGILDPDTAPAQFIATMLMDLGDPFGQFSEALSLVEQRELVKLLIPLYALKGTDPGMIDAIQLFTGVTVTITCPSWQGKWKLGIGLLGTTTLLGSSVKRDLYTFYVNSPVSLTAAQVTAIETLVAIMRRAPCHLGGILQPAPPPITPNGWELGLALLGTQTILH